MAIPISVVKTANAGLKNLHKSLVGVFVGGTSGIGEFTLTAFARYVANPRIYLVGRNQASAARITENVKSINSNAAIHFIKADTSLIRNVDVVCQEIAAKESKINVLFITTGYLTLAGRDETTEGLDRKFSLNYYSRVRFMQKLLPQLTAAAKEPDSFARVVTVLAAGEEGPIIEDDLELKKNFSLANCGNHTVVMNDLVLEYLAEQNPQVSFIHEFPGFVKTGILNNGGLLLKTASKILLPLVTPFAVSSEECGERNLYYSTSEKFACRTRAEDRGLGKGRGAYLLRWDGTPTGKTKILQPLRDKGMPKVIWDHTQEIFDRIINAT